MGIDWRLVAQILVPFATLLLGFWLNRRFERQVKLSVYLGHMSNFKLKEVDIYTHAIVVSNNGKMPATNVRICHHWLPGSIEIYPTMQYRIEKLSDGGADLIIDRLLPNGLISVQYLYFEPRNLDMIHRGVRCDQGFAKFIPVLQTRIYPNWVMRSLAGLVAIGTITACYLVIQFGCWIYRLTLLTH